MFRFIFLVAAYSLMHCLRLVAFNSVFFYSIILIVKPGKPEMVTASKIHSTDVNIKWNKPKYREYKDFTFLIQYKSDLEQDWVVN